MADVRDPAATHDGAPSAVPEITVENQRANATVRAAAWFAGETGGLARSARSPTRRFS